MAVEPEEPQGLVFENEEVAIGIGVDPLWRILGAVEALNDPAGGGIYRTDRAGCAEQQTPCGDR